MAIAADWDSRLLGALNGLSGRSATLDAAVVLLAVGAPAVYAVTTLCAWFALGRGRVHVRRVLVRSAVAAALAVGASAALAVAVGRPRPFLVAPATDRLLIARGADGSLPSDHGAFAFAVAATLASLGGPWAPLALAAAGLVGAARVFVGVHWPSDVVMGATVGCAAALAVRRFPAPVDALADHVMRWTGVSPRRRRRPSGP